MRWAGCFVVMLVGCERATEVPPRPVDIAPEFVVGQQPVRDAGEGLWPVAEALRFFPGRAEPVTLVPASPSRTFAVRAQPTPSVPDPPLSLGVLLRAGQCYVLGAAVEPRQDIDLQIYNQLGVLHRRTTGVPVAWLADRSLCPRESGLRRVEITLSRRPHPRTVTVQLFREDRTVR